MLHEEGGRGDPDTPKKDDIIREQPPTTPCVFAFFSNYNFSYKGNFVCVYLKIN